MSLSDMPIGFMATRWWIPEGQEKALVGLRRARRKCRALLEGASVPPYTTVEELCERLGAKRGRPIVLIPKELVPGETSGKYEQHLTEDRIYFPLHTSTAHQAHIICHELAHLLLEHIPELDAIDPDVTRLVLGRSHYSSPAEEQAEVLGTLLWQQLDLATSVPASAAVVTSLEHRWSRHV
ncbi:hypothetical protein AB0I16_30540 [Streptomyces sp. NPDC050703]|uniref:hypothetical protein n=1 Tax=Streptomyces sp. NPDC050703 TaxID=3157218 RepID=UPI003417F8A5